MNFKPNKINIKIGTWNSKGINNKYFELMHFLILHHIDILLVTETKLAPYIHFMIPGYKIYRADHPSDTRQGGAAIIIKIGLHYDELPPIKEEECQLARIKLYSNNLKVQIGSFYSAPANKVTTATFWEIVHLMSPCFIIGGDFNSKHPQWGSNVCNPRGRVLHDAVFQLSLQVLHPSEPTYYPTSNGVPDLLDFFIVKGVHGLCSFPTVLHELSSDHFPVVTTINVDRSNTNSPNLITYPFNWKEYTENLENLTDLKIPLKTPSDIDIAVCTLTRNIQYASNQASSKQTVANRYCSTMSFPPNIQILHQEKKKCRRLWESTKFPLHKTAYNRATRDLKTALKDMNNQATLSNLSRLNLQDGSLWKKSKYLTKAPERIPVLKMNNNWFTSAQEKANVFAEILKDQFTVNLTDSQEFTNKVNEKIAEPLQLSPFNYHFTPSQVKNAIIKSPIKKAPGHDLIVQPLLKAFPRKTLVFLTQIYNAMLRLAYFPQRWKHANIVMVPKPEKIKENPTNYRPISLLPLLSKIFERLLLPELLQYLSHLIPDSQFGFRQSHSCPQQLHRVVDSILDTYEKKEVCMGLFLDTEKAFDKVWHQGLLSKMKNFLPDTYYRLMQSYLSNRSFTVKVENSLSKSHAIKAGVPQGSVLGPFLYLIYTHDFPTPISDHITVAQFADDVAVLSRGTYESSGNELQRFVNLIDEWSKNWRVKMNPKKSKIIIFTYKRHTNHQPVLFGSEIIPQSETVRYLGLILDSRLTWKAHISHLINKLRNRIHQLKFIIQGKSPLPLHLKKLIYYSTIRPVWTYSCGIWGSAANSHVKKVQTIQNRVLRLIADAPWYISNASLHKDLQVPEVTEILAKHYNRLYSTFADHCNPLLNQIPAQAPPPQQERRLKRKRHSDLLYV